MTENVPLKIGVDALARGESQDLDRAIDSIRGKMRDRDRLLAQEKLVGMCKTLVQSGI